MLSLCNRGRQGVRVRLRSPIQARPFLSFVPEEVVLLPGPSRLPVSVKFTPSASLLQQCRRFRVSEQPAGDITSELEGTVHIPCQVIHGTNLWGGVPCAHRRRWGGRVKEARRGLHARWDAGTGLWEGEPCAGVGAEKERRPGRTASKMRCGNRLCGRGNPVLGAEGSP